MVLSVWVAAAALGAAAPVPPSKPAVAPPDQATTGSPDRVPSRVPARAGSGDGAFGPEATLTEPVAPTTADDDQKPPAPKPGFGGNFILDNSVPSGTFIFNNPYTFNPAVSTNLYLRPSYTFTIGSQSLKFEVSQNLSFADVLDKNSTITRRFTWSDTRVSLYDNKFYEEPHTKLQFAAYLRGSIPISYQSQFATLITSVSTAGAASGRTSYRFNLQLGLGATKNFHRQTSGGFPCSSSSLGPVAVVPGEAPDVVLPMLLQGFVNGICQSGATSSAQVVNTDWALAPSASVAYSITSKLSVAVAFYYIASFQYPVPVNQLSSPTLDSNGGSSLAVGQQYADSLWGITSLNYDLDEHWGLSAGVWNVGLPKTLTGGQFRFPFLDTFAFNSNDWNLFIDLSAYRSSVRRLPN